MKKVYCAFLLAMLILSLTACGERIKEPPKLMVSYENQEIEAIRFSYSWNDGMEAVEACGPHVLDGTKYMTSINSKDDNIITLKFAVEPDSLTVRYWDEMFSGDAENYESKYIELEPVDEKITIPTDRNYIFEIHGYWNGYHGASGDAYYGFYLQSADRKQQ